MHLDMCKRTAKHTDKHTHSQSSVRSERTGSIKAAHALPQGAALTSTITRQDSSEPYMGGVVHMIVTWSTTTRHPTPVNTTSLQRKKPAQRRRSTWAYRSENNRRLAPRPPFEIHNGRSPSSGRRPRGHGTSTVRRPEVGALQQDFCTPHGRAALRPWA
jgi:hypothetical protein